jgi:hypothetical protein
MIYTKEKLHNWLVKNFKLLPEKTKDKITLKYQLESLIEDVENNIQEALKVNLNK